MFRAVLALGLLSACSPQAGLVQTSAERRAAQVTLARGALEREHTGQSRPTILAQNRLARVQHLFLDWDHVARVEPQANTTLDVGLGTHTLTSADSLDPDDGAVSVTERFEPGFRYLYEIVAE